MIKTILMIGNGPSVASLDFKRVAVDSFGMNKAFSYFMKIGWFPTYHGCFDELMCKQHSYDLIAYVKKAKKAGNNLKKVFLPYLVSEYKPREFVETGWTPPTFEFTLKKDRDRGFYNVGGTGCCCCQIAIDMGYTRLILIGQDLNFKKEQNTKNISQNQIKLVGQPSNVNYGIPDYLKVGDVFNNQRPEQILLPAWRHLSVWSKKNNIEVLNCSSESQIKNLFRYTTLEDAGVYG